MHAREIYQAFIKPGAPNEINLDGPEKERFRVIIENFEPVDAAARREGREGGEDDGSAEDPLHAVFTPALFDGPQKTVLYLLQTDLYHRFLRSYAYEEPPLNM